ncbi:MAG: hypothetical protein JXR51_01090 [Bacteroidales bacterium]|nr:hypothetical protein [Bacteroidales bacterium]MBN2755738.1 hypothetical protein [Bacteroidales bacterium]
MLNKTIYYIIIILFVSNNFSVFAQTYPEVILPGTEKIIQNETDTLWVLKDSQLKKAIIAAKQLIIEEQINDELKKKISLMTDKDLVKDSLVVDLKKDRDFYENNWKTCSKDIDILIRKNQRQILFTRLSLGGVVLAFIAGILIK